MNAWLVSHSGNFVPVMSREVETSLASFWHSAREKQKEDRDSSTSVGMTEMGSGGDRVGGLERASLVGRKQQQD